MMVSCVVREEIPKIRDDFVSRILLGTLKVVTVFLLELVYLLNYERTNLIN